MEEDRLVRELTDSILASAIQSLSRELSAVSKRPCKYGLPGFLDDPIDVFPLLIWQRFLIVKFDSACFFPLTTKFFLLLAILIFECLWWHFPSAVFEIVY